MHIRFVNLNANPDKLAEVRDVFATRIFPGLMETEGCLFAGLIESSEDPTKFSSMTLWDSAESIQAYEDGGRFEELAGALRPYQAESDDWQLQLSEDLTLEYKPVVEEPEPQSYRLCAVMDEEALRQDAFVDMHLRLLRLQVRDDGFEGLRRTYVETVLPALRDVKGCKNALLLESAQSQTKLLSVTLWDAAEHALEYHRSSLFRSLIENTEELMSADVWQSALKTHLASRVYVNDDMTAEFYDVLAGRSSKASAPRKPPNTQASRPTETRPKEQDSPSK